MEHKKPHFLDQHYHTYTLISKFQALGSCVDLSIAVLRHKYKTQSLLIVVPQYLHPMSQPLHSRLRKSQLLTSLMRLSKVTPEIKKNSESNSSVFSDITALIYTLAERTVTEEDLQHTAHWGGCVLFFFYFFLHLQNLMRFFSTRFALELEH